MGLQMLALGLCEGSVGKGMVITPRPVMGIVGELRDAVRREIERQDCEENEGSNVKEKGQEMKEKTRTCLDRVMLSQVFDVDGLWEVLAELDEPEENPSHGDEPEEGKGTMQGKEADEEDRPVLEVKDSQEDDDSPLPTPGPEPTSETAAKPQREEDKTAPQKQPPAFILITHFSTLLTSLFTHREKSAAHSLLQLLSSRLRYLSRSLPSQPLIMLLNSTTTSSDQATTQQQQKRDRDGGSRGSRRPLDATLRSVFNPPELPGVQGYVSKAAAEYLRRNKPVFGLVFSQLLDVHLLCTRGEDDGKGGHEDLTVVEALLDEMGVWEGRMGKRRDREQRWGAVKVERGRVVDGLEEGRKVLEDVRIVAGFGGPRV